MQKPTPVPIFNHRKRPRQAVFSDPQNLSSPTQTTRPPQQKVPDLMPVKGFQGRNEQSSIQRPFAKPATNNFKGQTNNTIGQYRTGNSGFNVSSYPTKQTSQIQSTNRWAEQNSRSQYNSSQQTNRLPNQSNQHVTRQPHQFASQNNGVPNQQTQAFNRKSYQSNQQSSLQPYQTNRQTTTNQNQRAPSQQTNRPSNTYQANKPSNQYNQDKSWSSNSIQTTNQHQIRNSQSNYSNKKAPMNSQTDFTSFKNYEGRRTVTGGAMGPGGASFNSGDQFSDALAVSCFGDAGTIHNNSARQQSQPNAGTSHSNSARQHSQPNAKTKLPQSKKSSAVKPVASLRMVTADIQGMKHWSKFKDNIPMLFEVFGILDSAVMRESSGTGKQFLLRDESDSIQCLFYEIDRSLPKLTRGHWQRCIGSLDMKSLKFKCVSVRTTSDQERRFSKQSRKSAEETLLGLTQNRREP